MCVDGGVTAPAAAPKVQIVTITTCSSAGEALRAIDQKNLIKSDFVLVQPASLLWAAPGLGPCVLSLSAVITNGTYRSRADEPVLCS